MPRRDLDALVSQTRLAFSNARDDAELQAALAPFGYDPERLDEVLAFVGRAEDAGLDQQAEYAEQRSATAALQEQIAQAKAAYKRHVKLARIACKPGTPGYHKLGLQGDREESYDGFTSQARRFYRALADDAEVQAATAPLTLRPETATEGLAALDRIEASKATQTRETGEAQMATQTRNARAAELRGVWRDFRQVAAIALEAQPQLREKLGLLERA